MIFDSPVEPLGREVIPGKLLLTEVTDKFGDPIVVAVHLNRVGAAFRINNVASIYGMEYAGRRLTDMVENDRLEYYRNEKDLALFSSGHNKPRLGGLKQEAPLGAQGQSLASFVSRRQELSRARPFRGAPLGARDSGKRILTEADVVNQFGPAYSRQDRTNITVPSIIRDTLISNGISQNLKEKVTALEKAANGFTVTSGQMLDSVLADGNTNQDLKLLKVLQDTFRTPVALITTEGKVDFNGAFHGGVLWLNANTDVSPSNVFGHELSHAMEKSSPEAYRAMLDAVRPMLKNAEQYRKKNGLEGFDEAYVEKEMLGDIMGDRFGEPEFWQQVAANTSESNFKKIANVVRLYRGEEPDFTLGGGAGAGPEVGHIVTNAVGTFLKVIEDPKSQKMFAFVEISSGVVKSRQERGVTSVHLDWRVSGWGDGGAVGLDMLRDAFEKL